MPVVGSASGQGIPEMEVDRLLLDNIDVRRVGGCAFAGISSHPGQERGQAAPDVGSCG
jgi:NADPH2:quinone reductase